MYLLLLFRTVNFTMCLQCQLTMSHEATKSSFAKYRQKEHNHCHIFIQLKASLEKHKTLNTMFTDATVQENSGMIASYNIELLVVKTEKSYNIGQTMLTPVIEDVLSTTRLSRKFQFEIIKFLDEKMTWSPMSNINSFQFSIFLNFLNKWMSHSLFDDGFCSIFQPDKK